MKFFHVYNEQYFAGLVKNNLINQDSGFKIQHAFALEDKMKFNQFAAKGSRLHDLIKKDRIPFYVDRIAGGITYHKYDFDIALIREYKELLGNWFLGFQLHESGNNRLLDWQRVYDRMEGEKGPYDAKLLASRSVRAHAVTPEGKSLYAFSQGSPEEYASLRYPETVEAVLQEMTALFQRRMRETDGIILPCDSYQLFTRMQNEQGMQTFMPEVGGQIPHMRIAVALSRGMAKATGKSWGLYYECWRNVPGVGYTMPCFNKEPGNEWYLTQETFKDDFTSYGPNGGSSRLLQKRIYYYALMSGADYFSEEWGLNCSYSNMETFELSAYGAIKKEFVDFALQHREMKAQIPFAVILPKEFPCVQLLLKWGDIGQWRTNYLKREISPEQSAQLGKMEDVLKVIFMRLDEDICGNEGHVMQNSRFGDLFDILYEDASEEVLAKYAYLVDATGKEDFRTRMGDRFRILHDNDPQQLAEKLALVVEEELPCMVDSLHWLLSSDENGSYLTIVNNEGNERDLEKGDIVHHEADRTVKVTLKQPAQLDVLKTSAENVKLHRIDPLTYMVELPAAQFVILKFET